MIQILTLAQPHYDYFHDKVNSDPKHGGQRVVTMLMYLSTPEEGGTRRQQGAAARGFGFRVLRREVRADSKGRRPGALVSGP